MGKYLVKSHGSPVELLGLLGVLSHLGATGTNGGAVKCVEIGRNAGGESDRLGLGRRSGTKARGANGIRYPGSPGPKRCRLDRSASDGITVEAKVLSRPPGKYGRKAKTQRN